MTSRLVEDLINFAKGRFVLFKEISNGGNGIVHLALRLEDFKRFKESEQQINYACVRDTLVAIKVSYAFKSSREALKNEIRVLDHISKVLEGKEEERARFVAHHKSLCQEDRFLVLDRIDGVNLRKIRSRFMGRVNVSPPIDEMHGFKEPSGELETISNYLPPDLVAYIALDVWKSLKLMHEELKLAHGDIKMDNIILRNPTPNQAYPSTVLIDFGSSALEGDVRFDAKVFKDLEKFFDLIELFCRPVERYRNFKNNESLEEAWEKFQAVVDSGSSIKKGDAIDRFEKNLQSAATKILDLSGHTAKRTIRLLINQMMKDENDRNQGISLLEIESGIKKLGVEG
ncbi:kinase-like protein [Corynespora cassiicola Philippines]|uniref:Kinase-like protein n=1 Tax=Corynespora cassiicola Philippines TaxID=1448308 RepID=A0A2T2NHM7_CORCC|nr:kinase-like protein [Corynespora cassiicola Philippines]